MTINCYKIKCIYCTYYTQPYVVQINTNRKELLYFILLSIFITNTNLDDNYNLDIKALNIRLSFTIKGLKRAITLFSFTVYFIISVLFFTPILVYHLYIQVVPEKDVSS